MRVRRIDSTGALGKAARLPAGGALVPASLTRVGVFLYRLSDGGERRELRPPEEVFRPDSLATLRLAPVTVLHPSEEVTAENWKDYAVGMVAGLPTHDEKFVNAELAINHKDALDKIDSRELHDISCGYRCELEMKSGTFNGEKYDAIQRNISYNHVALGGENWGRAGSDVSMHLDAGDAILISERSNEMKIKIGGKEYSSQAEAQAAIDALEKRSDSKAIAKAAKYRADLVMCARILSKKHKAKLDEEALAEAAEPDLLVQMIQIVRPKFSAEGKSEDYIKGVFESIIPVALEEYVANHGVAEEPAEESTEGESTEATSGDAEGEEQEEEEEEEARDNKTAKRPVFSARPAPPKKDSKRSDNVGDAGDQARKDLATRQAARCKKK